mgnify:CR=1 FL=1
MSVLVGFSLGFYRNGSDESGMTTTNTAADTNRNQVTNRLVIRSIREAAIVTGHWTLGRQQELTRMCAGKSDVDGVQEYWGDTDMGDHWHVILK